jgi:hypothetical protein
MQYLKAGNEPGDDTNPCIQIGAANFSYYFELLLNKS